jgi:hypothetical protein
MRQTVNDSGLKLKKTGGLDDDDIDLGEGTPLSMEDIKFIRPSPELPTALAVLGGVSKPMMYAGGRDGMAGSVHFTCAHILLPEQVAQDICNGGGSGGGGDEDHPPEVVKPRRKSLWKSLAAMTGIHSKIDIGGQYKCVSSFAPADGEAASISVAVISNTPSSHNSLTATDRHEKKALFGSRRRATSQHGTADHSEDAHPTWSSVSSVMTLVGLRGGVEVMRATPFQQSYPVALPTPICAGGLPGDSFITLALETDVNASLWEQLLDSERDTHRRETAPNSFLRHGSWVTSTTSTPQKVAMPFSAVAVAHSDGSVSLIGLSRDRNDESFGKSLKSLNRSFDNDDTNSEDEESEDDDEDDEEGSAASHRPNVAPQTTPSALTLSRIGVKKILETDLLDEEKSGHLQVTSVSLLLEHGLCCIAVGGEHKCSGQVALMQLCSVDGRESAVGDLAEEPAEKSVDIVGSKAAPPPIQNTVVDKVDNNDSDSDSDLSIDDMVAASRREAESLVASPMSADDIDIPSSPRSASSTASGLKDKKEEAGGKCKYIWKRAYKLVAHDTAVRCLTTGVSSNGCVMIACADGGGVVSVTDTRTGCTRLLPCGETRGGLVQSKTQVRDQRIVKLSFGSKTFMANDKGTSLLCIGLACGEVQVLDTSSMTIVNIFITNQQQAGSSINLSTAAINLPSASQSGCSLTQVIPSKKQSSSPLLLVAAGVNVSLYQLNKHNAVASVQLGATPIMAATLLATSEYNGHLAVAFTSDWVAYVIAVNEAPNAGLKVLGMKQIQPPGGAPPWETAPVIGDASSSTAKAFERKVVAPGGGGVAIDDSEAEAGGPGWRCIFSKWGELLVTAHGSTELLRLPVVDWSPLALAPASGVIDMSGSGKLDMSALMQEVNIGPEFRAELPLPSTQSLRGSMSGAGATGPTGADEAAPPPPPPTEHNTPRRSSLFRLSSTTKSPPQQTSTPTSSVVDDEDDVEETVNNTNNNIDLAAVFDHFDRPAIHYEEGEKAEDLSHLSPEERTKRLLEQRGEALANMEDKSRKVAEAAEAYRDGTAKIKQEAVKQNKKWPF